MIITKVEFNLQQKFTPKTNYGDLDTIAKHKAAQENQALNAQHIARAVIEIRQSKLPDPKPIGNVGSFFHNPIIEKIIIPLLPVYIFTMICEMSAKGTITALIGAGFKIILTGIVLSVCYLVIQYGIAGIIARKNPFKCLWNMSSAYLTAFSICSSSATIPVTSACAKKNGIREDIVDFTIPLCSTVHMCGSTIKLAVSSIAIAYIFNIPLPFAVYAHFVFMQGIAAVAAPGVMGGVLMASVGLLESIMGFGPEQTALVMTLYLALDGYGPACNVTGDGAIALVIDSIFKKKDNE